MKWRLADAIAFWTRAYSDGLTMVEAARQMGIAVTTLRTHVTRARRAGIPVPTPQGAHLSDAEVLEEWSVLRHGGEPLPKLAKRIRVPATRLRSLVE